MPTGMVHVLRKTGWGRSWVLAGNLVPREVKAQFSSTTSCLCPLKSPKHRSHTASTIVLAIVGVQWGGERGGVILSPTQFQSQFSEGCVITLSSFAVDTVQWCYYSYGHDVAAVTLSRIKLAQICVDMLQTCLWQSWILSLCWNSWDISHVCSSWKSICMIMATIVNKNPPNSCSSSSTWLF